MVLLSALAPVFALPVPMNSPDQDGRVGIPQTRSYERLSKSVGSSSTDDFDVGSYLPRVLAIREPGTRTWLAKQVPKLKHSLSFSRADQAKRGSDLAMERMIKNRPTDTEFHKSVVELTKDPKRVAGVHAVQLPQDQGLGSQVLTILTRRRKPFFVVDSGGRVWFFDAKKDGDIVHFTYNGDLKGGNDVIVRESLGHEAAQSIEAKAKLIVDNSIEHKLLRSSIDICGIKGQQREKM
ncbi:mitochondrial ATPase subunit ATP4 [Pseudozyma hubeiensis SY62]|uniref:Mitochondrial ATPase subunit ATP4 n=1 Tax=Pseudozyma hubeiensis (strain SY62) TaxID=1305764 RepID=R9NVT7_PSEHS|nr:mitochondrial ATPase subunit ATP4 [Pseudozyma hubeiensis SY62]GAC92527.1 mitochondrial ATPase subunit ATP4 [Pseudozyma hubeiensis SY62]